MIPKVSFYFGNGENVNGSEISRLVKNNNSKGNN
jgi:hypothetical protein